MHLLDTLMRSTRSVLSGRSRTFALAGVVGAVGAGGLLHLGGGEEPTVASVVSAVVESPVAEAPLYRAGLFTDDWDLPDLEHERVDYWLDRFQNNPDMRAKFEGFLERSGLYRDLIAAELAARDMPQDLIYLAMIESGFQAEAYSPAAASGLWQFISETGRRYGLRVDREIDERNDPVKATGAALDYLEDLHDRFGSWYLASAAYNTGENRVGRIMREETGSERATSEADYYLIWDRLPRETRDYVPLMIAAARIGKDPAAYGFDHVQPLPPLRWEVVVTDAELDLEEVARAAGADPDEVELLNAYLKEKRLPSGERIALRLPEGTGDAFRSNWSKIAANDAADRFSPQLYTVRRGDNLSVIAQRHGTSVSELRSANGLRSDRIYAGQKLQIAR